MTALTVDPGASSHAPSAPGSTKIRAIASTVHAYKSLQRGVLLLGALLLLGLVVSPLLPDPNAQDLTQANAGPFTSGHLFGTDPLGRDVLSWSLSGIRTSLLVGLAVAVLSCVLGVAVGVVAGYAGGVLDALLMRTADLWLAIPPLLLFIAAAAVVRPTATNLILFLGLTGWVPYARTTRSRVLSERERAHVAAARLAGSGTVRIMGMHLLPSVVTLAIVVASLQVGYVMVWEASLGFLGLGIKPPSTSLGFMIAQGRSTPAGLWWVILFPGLLLMSLVFAVNQIGDGLRDAFQLDQTEIDR